MSLPAFAPASRYAVPTGRKHQVAALLRERPLDRRRKTHALAGVGVPVAAFDQPSLDARLSGGVPRGELSELVGSASSGRTTLAWTWLAAATARGESVALIDTFDRFDPATGAACGIELSRLLWVRGQAITKTAGAVDPAWLPGARAVDGPGTLLERTIDRALKALNLVLQSGVCTAVVLDIIDVPVVGLRRIPLTTWLRLHRVIDGTETACLVLGALPLARSAGGITIQTGALEDRAAPASWPAAGVATGAHVRWQGAHDRARRPDGAPVSARVASPRRHPQQRLAIAPDARLDAATVDRPRTASAVDPMSSR